MPIELNCIVTGNTTEIVQIICCRVVTVCAAISKNIFPLPPHIKMECITLTGSEAVNRQFECNKKCMVLRSDQTAFIKKLVF